MRIRKKLQITVVVSVLMALAICLVLFMALYRLDRANNAEKIADEIMTGILERVTFRNDYIRNNTSRAKAQWFATHEEIGKLLKLAAESFRTPEDRGNIAGLLENEEAIGKIFSAIVASREKGGPSGGSAELAAEVEDRLLNQLNMRVYDIVIHSRNLLESSGNARVSALRQAGWGVVSTLLILIAAVLINSWAMGRALSDRIGRLREGAAVIGSGDLEHRIDIRGDDEFAELAESFNFMTAKLSGSYYDLKKEVVERKRAEEVLRESEEKLSLALRSAGLGVWRLDLRTQKRHFDTRVCRTLGIDPESFRGTAEEFFAAVHPDDRAVIKAALDRTVASGALYEVEYRAVWPDGSIRHITARGQLTRNSAGQPQWVDGLVWDATERKHAEKALEMAHDELARLVEERTGELREKEVLLKEVHHRVKNNLQVISSLVSLQVDGSTDETVREVLRDVTYRIRSMALIHEKLYQSESLSRVDFAEYIRSLLSYLWRAHGSAAATVRLTLDLAPVSFTVDTAVPCGLILNELAGNALKHAFRGRSEGEVTVSLKSGADGLISLCVSDNGVGLPAGFDWREASSLGLRLVQMLAGQLGGDVEIESGVGTRFEISFCPPS